MPTPETTVEAAERIMQHPWRHSSFVRDAASRVVACSRYGHDWALVRPFYSRCLRCGKEMPGE